MSKRIALTDFVEVDNVDLSEFARSVQSESTHAKIDVSGFNSSGRNEYLAGMTEQSVTVEFFDSAGSGEVHHTVYPLHAAKTIFGFRWRRDQVAGVSATNPELRGMVQALGYGPGATRGDVATLSVEFSAADENGLVWFDT